MAQPTVWSTFRSALATSSCQSTSRQALPRRQRVCNRNLPVLGIGQRRGTSGSLRTILRNCELIAIPVGDCVGIAVGCVRLTRVVDLPTHLRAVWKVCHPGVVNGIRFNTDESIVGRRVNKSSRKASRVWIASIEVRIAAKIVDVVILAGFG